jgi:subtilisin family serine protease
MRSAGLACGAALAVLLSACGGGGGGGGTPSTPAPSPTSTASSTGFTCPTSTTSLSIASSGGVARAGESRRRFVNYRTAITSSSASTSNLLVVTYDTSRLQNAEAELDARAATYGGRTVTHLNFSRIQRAVHVMSVNPSQMTQAETALRAEPGVLNVQRVQRRFAQTVAGPYFTANPDPYFYNTAKGYQTFPYETSSPPPGIPGQWDMHVVRLEDAFAYSQPGNTVAANSNALGSRSVKLAIIDTGMDVTHPDLAKDNIVRTECFITDTSGVQSTSSFVTDPTGHGTDVAGIAAGATSQGYGFQGDAGNVSLMLYRVFPTPDDNCTNPSSTDPRCSAADVDIASAIDDAVAHGANVISMSFGGGTCVPPSSSNPGGDPSSAEGTAVEAAVTAGVVVVAASGNGAAPSGGTVGVASPACDTGVIAVGASGYYDGNANGSGYTGPDLEYVANYSQYGSPSSALNSTTAWGIVAPGGDPDCGSSGTSGECSSTGTVYDLHWIENIWTSTPYDSNFGSASDCVTDYFGEASNCRTLIAGTSMATPHVAGAAALILSVNPGYQSSSGMKSLLCSTADDIGVTTSGEGCGRLDVYRAMAKALSDPSQPTPPPL